MKRAWNAVGFFLGIVIALDGSAQKPASRVADDARAIDRVAEASKRDLPTDLLKRIVEEDLDLLRGKRPDGSYEYATWERFEASRIERAFSIGDRKDRMEVNELRGSNVYRVVVGMPSRRMVVRRNNPVWVERVDVDYIREGSTQSRQETFDVKAWLKPGEIRPIDLPAIGRQVTARVIATTEPGKGYGNLDLALVQARIVDLTTSPYADAVASAKALQRALDGGDINTIRAHSQRMGDALRSRVDSPMKSSTAPSGISPLPTVAPAEVASRVELQAELQVVESLLRGTESQRQEGLERLRTIIERIR